MMGTEFEFLNSSPDNFEIGNREGPRTQESYTSHNLYCRYYKHGTSISSTPKWPLSVQTGKNDKFSPCGEGVGNGGRHHQDSFTCQEGGVRASWYFGKPHGPVTGR